MSLHSSNEETCQLAARERLDNRQHAKPFVSAEDVMVFFLLCSALHGPDV